MLLCLITESIYYARSDPDCSVCAGTLPSTFREFSNLTELRLDRNNFNVSCPCTTSLLLWHGLDTEAELQALPLGAMIDVDLKEPVHAHRRHCWWAAVHHNSLVPLY